MSVNLLIPNASRFDIIPGIRRLRLIMYSQRPNIIDFKTKAAEWVLLKSRWRFLHALYPYLGPPSYLVRRLFFPILFPTLIALACTLWDTYGVYPLNKGKIYQLVFRLTSFCMSLLLAYRINRVYDRWWAARAAFSGVGSGCVSLMRQACAWTDDAFLLGEIQRWGILWHFAITQCVLDMKRPDKRAVALMNDAELAAWNGTRKPRQLAMTKMTLLVRECNLGPFETLAMENTIQVVANNHGLCARIHYTAMPYAITLHCTGFVFIWCLLLPFGLYPGGSWGGVLATCVAAMMLLGTDEVANQLENPFKHLPTEDIVITTMRDLPRVWDEVKLLRRNEVKQLAARAAAAEAAAAAAAPDPSPAALPAVGMFYKGAPVAPVQATATLG